MNKTFISLLLALLLTACASGVKLNEVPVVDKKGSDVSSGTSGSGMSEISSSDSSSSQQVQQPKSSVEPVNSLGNDKASNQDNLSANQDNLSAGPANVEKIVYFDYDSYTIKPEFQSTIEAHAQFLKANNRAKLSLEGHTDERGGREYNLALGQKRADAVRQGLTLLGVNAAQVETVSFGEEKPAMQGNDESAFSKNRRAEFFYK
ncbi:MAG: peptidoglycan-associated lipoprotein Pal [Burkholderiaceae bacterium]|nr:peptidoglycan-associated lipoprotein Pal [Burkholderiaceae bacterium]